MTINSPKNLPSSLRILYTGVFLLCATIPGEVAKITRPPVAHNEKEIEALQGQIMQIAEELLRYRAEEGLYEFELPKTGGKIAHIYRDESGVLTITPFPEKDESYEKHIKELLECVRMMRWLMRKERGIEAESIDDILKTKST